MESVSTLPQRQTAALTGHEGAILAVRFNADGRYCLTCGRDRTLRLWNPHKGLPIKTYLGHGRDVKDVSVSSDNSRLASCGGDRQVFLWDVSSGRIVRKFRGHDSEVNSVRFHQSGNVIVSGSYDRSCKVWDHRSNSIDPIQVMNPFTDSVTSVAVTDVEIIAGSVDGSVRTFDIRLGRVVTDDLGQAVTSVSLSSDGQCVLAGCLDSRLKLLDRASGELLNEYTGHVNKSYAVSSCLTSTDAHVVSGSEDGQVCFWDLVDGDMVTSIQAHTKVVTGVSYHPKEACMITCSVDGTAKVWKT